MSMVRWLLMAVGALLALYGAAVWLGLIDVRNEKAVPIQELLTGPPRTRDEYTLYRLTDSGPDLTGELRSEQRSFLPVSGSDSKLYFVSHAGNAPPARR